MYVFSDGLRISDTTRDYDHIVGLRGGSVVTDKCAAELPFLIQVIDMGRKDDDLHKSIKEYRQKIDAHEKEMYTRRFNVAEIISVRIDLKEWFSLETQTLLDRYDEIFDAVKTRVE